MVQVELYFMSFTGFPSSSNCFNKSKIFLSISSVLVPKVVGSALSGSPENGEAASFSSSTTNLSSNDVILANFATPAKMVLS